MKKCLKLILRINTHTLFIIGIFCELLTIATQNNPEKIWEYIYKYM